MGNSLEIVLEAGAVQLSPNARPAPDERAQLKSAAALVKLAVHQSGGGQVYGLDEPQREGLSAMLPDPCHQALLARKGTLLSATPLMPALPSFALREVQVTDGARVRRVMLLAGRRGSWALTRMYRDGSGKYVQRAPEPGEPAGVPWPVVAAAVKRARDEAQRYECKRVLFVTFKGVADALRASPVYSKYDWLDVAHYGALRGKNDWMEGRPQECSVIYCLGTPRSDILPTLAQLGLTGEAADQAWRAYAAGELTQAEGRLRLPRRTKPCSVLVEGDVAPSSWTSSTVDEVIELDV
jgi:hypothetical protein